MLIKTIFLTGELRDGRGTRTVIIIIIIIIINFSKHNYCLEKFSTKFSFHRSFCSRPEYSNVNTLLAIILFLIIKFKFL